jgi:hypothetical protein
MLGHLCDALGPARYKPPSHPAGCNQLDALVAPSSKLLNFEFSLLSLNSTAVQVIKSHLAMPRKSQNQNKKKSNKPRPKRAPRKRTSVASTQDKVMRPSDYVDPRPKLSRGPRTSTLRLSACSAKYALCLADPFNPEVVGACLPSLPGTMTQKLCVHGGVDAAIGAGQIGWVILVGGAFKDGITCFYTTSTYGGTTANPFSANNVLAPGVASYTLPLMYASTVGSTTGEASAYVANIALAARASYTGTMLNRGGLVYCYNEPTMSSISGLGPPALVARQECEIHPVGSKSCELTLHTNTEAIAYDQWVSTGSSSAYYPFNNRATVTSQWYPSNFTYADSSGTNVPASTCVMMFTGQGGNTFHVDLVQYQEAIGPTPSSAYTKHGVDRNGADRVTNAMQELPQVRRSTGKHGWNAMWDTLALVGKEAVEVILPHAASALIAMIA